MYLGYIFVNLQFFELHIMEIKNILSVKVSEGVKSCFNGEIAADEVQTQETRKDFEGDITVVVFPFTRYSRRSPEETGKILGDYLKENVDAVEDFNVVKGFLNIVISSEYWLGVLADIEDTENYGYSKPGAASKTIMIEYSSPNTNKPLHLGHIRNNFLGWSVAEILKANGHRVIKTI